MRIAILNLTGGGISGGNKKYLVNMLPRLAEASEVCSILFASPVDIREESRFGGHGKISFHHCSPYRPFMYRPDSALSSLLDSFAPDIIFVPVERYIDYKDVPVVVMVQNMAPLSGTKTGYGVREWVVSHVRRYETGVAIKRSSAVITPTETVRQVVLDAFSIPEDVVHAVPYGNTPIEVPCRSPESVFIPEGQFIFTAGSLEAYRGIEDLLEALPGIKAKFPGIKLLIAGGARPATSKYLDSLKKMAVRLGVSGDVFWLGSLPENALAWYYANCAAFVTTSRVESFCFIALEAISHGANCISTLSPCLPEVLADAAVYYPAGNVISLGEALSVVLGRTPAERAGASAKAAARAAQFTWDATVEKTLKVFKSLKRT